MEKQIVELVFEGLDTSSTVWINGVKIAETNNMFIPWRLNVKSALKVGKNIVAIRFRPIYKVARELEERHKAKYTNLWSDNFSARPYVRKAQYSFGWDWGPTLPTCGIWRDCKIVAYDHAILNHFGALTFSASGEKAELKLIAKSHTSDDSIITAKFMLEGFNQKIEREINFTVRQEEVTAICYATWSKK